MEITKEPWGSYEGTDIYHFKLHNGQMEVTLTNFGATVTGIRIPDKDGVIGDVVLGYDTLEAYISDDFYLGSTIGRFAGRISTAKFTINGATYTLAQNEGHRSIHLHGGNKGFSKRAFRITDEKVDDDGALVEFYYRSLHMEEGYPGNLDVWVTYRLTPDNQLQIKYRVISDRDTHINLTNHSYFNLSGQPNGALDSKLFIDAETYVVTDEAYVPTGEIRAVKNTPYDFNSSQAIKTNMAKLNGAGFNECFVLNTNGNPHAMMYDETTGRKLTLETDMPALLFYSGDYLNSQFIKCQGVCLETQFYPDSPNHPNFPSTLLAAGKQWKSFTSFGFEWE